MKHLTLLFISLLISTFSIAQITEGSLKMSFKNFEMNAGGEEGAAGVGDMMKNMKFSMHFKEGIMVNEISMMGMIDMKQIFKDGKSVQYMDMMGQKIKMEMDPKDAMKDLGISEEDMNDMYQITYNKDKTKNILGFDCYEAVVVMDMEAFSDDMGAAADVLKKMEITMYITDDIKVDQYSFQQIKNLKIEGLPMHINMDMGMMSMTMEVTDFTKDIDPAVFDAPEGEYKEMSIEDMKSMGMDGFGF